MTPAFSICIPTYNRASLLDDCLKRLEPLRSFPIPFEIVVSDNGSTDATPSVLAAYRERNPHVRSYRLPENRGSTSNWLNSMCKAKSNLVVYLADDDSIIPENLIRHVERMVREPRFVALYTDWIAWDDQRECELHRYFGLESAVTFEPGDAMGLVNFVIRRMLPPEIAVFRRDALLQAFTFTGRALVHRLLMYRISRLGPIAFDPLPFYREHRVLKPQFQRTHWANMDMQLQFIGDETRLTLESLLLLALQDSGLTRVPNDQVLAAKDLIDRLLHSRLGLEIKRACARKDWILAVELKRRVVLWHGPGTAENIQSDVRQLSLPAALQAIHETFRSLSDVSGVSFRGFETGQVQGAFASHYPSVPLIDLGSSEPSSRLLIVHRNVETRASDRQTGEGPNVLVLSNLVDLYRVAQRTLDLRGL